MKVFQRYFITIFLLLTIFILPKNVLAIDLGDGVILQGVNENRDIYTNVGEGATVSLYFPNDSYSLTECYAGVQDQVVIEGNSCTITINDYGKYGVNIGYSDGVMTNFAYFNVIVGQEEMLLLFEKAYFKDRDMSINEFTSINNDFLKIQPILYAGSHHCRIANDYTYTCEADLGYYGYDYNYNVSYSGKISGLLLDHMVDTDYYVSGEDLTISLGSSYSFSYYNTKLADLVTYVKDENIIEIEGNLIKAVGVGETELIVFNIKTNEVHVRKVRVVNSFAPSNSIVYITGTEVQNKIDAITDSLVVDVGDLPQYVYLSKDDTANYDQIATYALLSHIFEGYTYGTWYTGFSNISSTCEEATCTVSFDYDETQQGTNYQTYSKTFNLKLAGLKASFQTVNATDLTDEYPSHYNISEMFMSYLAETDTLTYEYDTAKIKIEDGKLYFLEPGDVTLTVVAKDANGLETYRHTYKFFVKINWRYIEEISKYHNETTKEIELDYYKENFTGNLDVLESLIIEKYYEGFPVKYREYAQIDAVCLSEEKCILSLTSEKEILDYYNAKVKTITYNETNDDFNDLEVIVSKIKDLYVINFDEYIKINVASTGDETKYYNNLRELLGISSLFTDKVYTMEITGERKFGLYDNVYGNLAFTLNIKYTDEILYTKDINILVNPILNVSVEESYVEEDQVNYANNYLRTLLANESIECAFVDNSTLMSARVNDTFDINFIYNQPERIDVTYVYSEDNNYQMAVGDVKTLKLLYHPSDANYMGNVEYSSSDESVLTVDADGNMTAHKKGYAIVTMAISKYNSSNVVVLVDTTLTEFLNMLAYDIDNNVEITYGDLRYQSIESALLGQLYSSYKHPEYSYINHIQTHVNQVDNDYYFTKEIFSSIDYQNYSSDAIKINYDIKGINVGKEYYELNVGEVKDIEVTFTEGDNDNLYYRLDNPTIATINDDGKLIALKKGSTRVDIYDKKSKYHNYFYVYVELGNYITEKFQEIKQNPLMIEPTSYIGELRWNFEYAFQDLLSSYDYTDSGYDVECDETAKTCDLSIEIGGVLYSDTFAYEISGILIEDEYQYYEIAIVRGGTHQITATNYTVLEDKTITYTSIHPNVCTVSDSGLVTAVGKGLCTVVLENAAHNQKVLTFKIDADGVASEIENLYDELPNELDVKLLPYNSNATDSYMTTEVYWALISHLLDGYLNDGYEYHFEFSPAHIVDGYMDVIVTRAYRYEDREKEIFSYTTFSSVNPKKIKINFLSEEVVPDENLDKIVNSLERDYTLSVSDAMRYRMNGSIGGLWKYCSEFRNAVEKYEGYSILFDGRAGSGGDLYSASEGGYYVIMYEGAPVAYGEVWFTIIYNAVDNVPKTQSEFMEYLEDLVRDIYLDLISIPTGTVPYGVEIPTDARAMLMPPVGRNSSDDISVKIEYVGTSDMNELYKVDVEDIQFGVEVARQSAEDYTYKVTNIVTNKTNLNLKVGASETITYTITPENATDKTVTWTSSNNNVATVVNGKVTAVGVGNAEITIRSNDGNFTKVIYVSVEASIKTGDVNNDGKININDLILVRKHLAGINTLTGDKLASADVNKDNKVNINDVIRIRKFLAGLGNL